MMSFEAFMLNFMGSRADRKRDAAIPIPEGVVQHRDIAYYGNDAEHLLDVYYPEGTGHPLPTIVSIHGGGYVYGSKEIYLRYCMYLAKQGFAVVNFNYRLAPKSKFPAPLEDTNHVMEWICAHASEYHLSPDCLFIVGDSAGAQLTSHYCAIWSNPEFAKPFSFTVPAIHIRAVGLNCGMYDVADYAKKPRKGLSRDYVSKDNPENDPRFDVLNHIGPNFPPAHLTTSYYDFLKENAQPMCDFLKAKGIDAQWELYGSEDRKEISHVFHVNIIQPEAIACNTSQCDFFKKYI